MAFRLGTAIPNPSDGTSFYRGVGPLRALQNDCDDFSFDISDRIDWTYIRGIDAMFLQRPYTTANLGMIALAKAHGKPVWIDYDDDLFTVPLSNPASALYNNKTIENNIMTALVQADFISVSTPALKEKIGRIIERIASAGEKNGAVPYRCLDPEKVVHIPNAYDEKMFGYSFRHWHEPLPPAGKLMAWRGSPTHDADLWEYTQPIGKAFHDFGKDWTFNLVGHPFWLFLRELERTYQIPSRQLIVVPAMDPVDYFRYLHKTRPAVVVVPLLDDPFNRAKSNVAWLEATHAGSLVIAPHWEQWRRPGIITYKDHENLAVTIAQVLEGRVDRDACVKASRDYVGEYLTLTKVNERRQEMLDRLAKVDVWSQ